MINKENVGSVAVLSGAGADRVSPEGIVTAITSEQISNMVIFGLTFGAWVTLAVGIGAFLVVLINLKKAWNSYFGTKNKFDEIKKSHND